MSCGSPHEIDCREVLEEVYLYLDGEMDESERGRVRHHLDECAPCLRLYGLEQEVKVLVARCCGADPAPEGLRARVMVRIQEVVVDLDQVEYRVE